jgi:membrane protein
MGAALSYYTLFSIAPLLVIVIAVAGLLFGEEAARGEIFAQLRGLMGRSGADAVEDLVKHARRPEQGTIATVIGSVVLLFGATTVFGELQNALDRIWRAPARKKEKGWWRLLRTRVLSFGMILGVAFLLMVSLVLSAVLAAFGKWWGGALGAWPFLTQVLDLAVSFGLMTLLFALIYKLIPRVPIEWRDVWFGAAVTAGLFALGKSLIGLYLGRSSMASAYGAAGSLVVMMVWVYYSAQIFLLGAEFTWVWAHAHGSRRTGAAPEAAGDPDAAPALALAGGVGRSRALAVAPAGERRFLWVTATTMVLFSALLVRAVRR